MDDFYIQRGTLARVEIGDRSSWKSCTWREIQKPSAWSNSSITIQLNRGSFQQGQTAYLYVVDANGTVNSQGYPFTVGGGGSGGSTPPPPSNDPPSPPTGLKVID
jgi:hypothetical protein